MKERDAQDLRSELLEHADETRRLIARFADDSEAWRGKALLACLKNDQAILEALAVLLARPARAEVVEVEELQIVETVVTTTTPTTPSLPDSTVEGPEARAIIEEFDNRDHAYDRGLEKLNSWLAGGRGALPFQKRDMHAYLNRGANSEAMIARIETELMGREGFTRRLGLLKVDGLEGDILVYEKGGA